MSDEGYLDHILYFYNRRARRYDLTEFIRRPTRQRAVALSDWQPGQRVLDVCTGTGELALAFGRRGASVVGVDVARGSLERAAAKAAGRGVAWIEMDATKLAFADGAFDVSAVSLILHHMREPTQRRLLAEVARVTRRRIVIVEPHAPPGRRRRSLKGAFFSRLDESEHMREWMRQDFRRTCRAAGLAVEAEQVTTMGIHRITLCTPDGKARRASAE